MCPPVLGLTVAISKPFTQDGGVGESPIDLSGINADGRCSMIFCPGVTCSSWMIRKGIFIELSQTTAPPEMTIYILSMVVGS
jgi:hypothetical protein